MQKVIHVTEISTVIM